MKYAAFSATVTPFDHGGPTASRVPPRLRTRTCTETIIFNPCYSIVAVDEVVYSPSQPYIEYINVVVQRR